MPTAPTPPPTDVLASLSERLENIERSLHLILTHILMSEAEKVVSDQTAAASAATAGKKVSADKKRTAATVGKKVSAGKKRTAATAGKKVSADKKRTAATVGKKAAAKTWDVKKSAAVTSWQELLDRYLSGFGKVGQ